MIGAFLTFFTGSRLARWIGAAVMGIVALVTFGKIKRREGVHAERAKEAARDALQMKETIKEVSHEKISNDPADAVRQRLRDRAGKP